MADPGVMAVGHLHPAGPGLIATRMSGVAQEVSTMNSSSVRSCRAPTYYSCVESIARASATIRGKNTYAINVKRRTQESSDMPLCQRAAVVGKVKGYKCEMS